MEIHGEIKIHGELKIQGINREAREGREAALIWRGGLVAAFGGSRNEQERHRESASNHGALSVSLLFIPRWPGAAGLPGPSVCSSMDLQGTPW